MQPQILVVDDDALIRYSLSSLLEDDGYSVCTAADGTEALRLLKTVNIELIIADIWMPGMTGLELLPAAREIDPDLPVILLTANASLDTSIEAVNRGASAYLLKPYSIETVTKTVARCLQKSAKARRQQPSDQANLLQQFHDIEDYLTYMQQNQKTVNAGTISVISDLIRGIRHELGNLATVIDLDVALLEENADSPLAKSGWTELRDNVGDLGRLLSRLKEYPTPNARLEPVDLGQVIATAVEYTRKQARTLHMTINYPVPTEHIMVNGDESGLCRVLINVLDNALEANRQTEKKSVDLSVTVVGTEAIMMITDQGPGFSVEVLDAPFSPAYTTKITSGFLRGLGMGLFVSQAIISLHDGSITLQNRPAGGAQVVITLPILSDS